MWALSGIGEAPQAPLPPRPTDAEVREAQARLVALRDSIARWQDTRRKWHEIIAGLRPARVSPDQAARVFAALQKPQAEEAAKAEFARLVGVLRQAGIAAGLRPPESGQAAELGFFLPLLFLGGTAFLVGRTAPAVKSYFDAQQREEARKLAEIAEWGPFALLLRWELWAAAAAVIGGIWWVKRQRARKQPILPGIVPTR